MVDESHTKQNPKNTEQPANQMLFPETEQDIEQREEDADQQEYELTHKYRVSLRGKWKRTATYNKVIAAAAGVSAISTLAYAIFALLQWFSMGSQLGEIRKSAGDTHELAVQAKNQADRTKEVADRALMQANATNDLAKQAKRAADLSEKTWHSDERAWVGPNLITLTNPPLEANKEIFIGVNFCNSGKTPALNLVGYADAELISSRVTVDFSRFVTPPGLIRNVIFPGACHHFQRSIQALPQPVFEDLHHGASKVIVFGLTKYEDIFGQKHWTHFCMSYSVPSNGFVSCETYNETDDQKQLYRGAQKSKTRR